jgi:fatty-acyl-CoA synthase
MAGYKVPRKVLFIDAFPVTNSANGEKIQRERLRRMALSACAS